MDTVSRSETGHRVSVRELTLCLGQKVDTVSWSESGHCVLVRELTLCLGQKVDTVSWSESGHCVLVREWTLCLNDYYACVSAWWEDWRGGDGTVQSCAASDIASYQSHKK